MKESDNSTRKIYISRNFILSLSLLIMFCTLLIRPSLHCNTPLHFTTLHPTTLHYTSPNYTSLHFTTLHPTTLHYTHLHFTSSHLHFTTLSFSFTHLHFLSRVGSQRHKKKIYILMFHTYSHLLLALPLPFVFSFYHLSLE